jgi:alkanesulfonate monooxygenase SsuD/methylene tetrahydromethanopterin reductase-like flavin-dependent oxidoreductase (luciferase family)
VRLGLRYDMRSPAVGVAGSRLWRSVVDQCVWADGLSAETVLLGEHHGDVDGYNPSPMLLAAAILGSTERIGVHLSALVAPLHDPVRLAEDLAVLSLLGGGRVEVTLGIGYRPHEYAMFGVDRADRRRLLKETVDVLRAAWRGDAFDHDGRRVLVRPLPDAADLPRVHFGGSTERAAREAARAGLGFRPGVPELWDAYADELVRLGRPVPDRPPVSGPAFLFVTDDPDRDLARLAPNLLDTTNTYAEWALERGAGSTKYRPLSDPAELAARGFRVVTPAGCIELAERLGPGGELRFHPLMGGIDPDLAWTGLRRFEDAVLPELEARGLRNAAARASTAIDHRHHPAARPDRTMEA